MTRHYLGRGYVELSFVVDLAAPLTIVGGARDFEFTVAAPMVTAPDEFEVVAHHPGHHQPFRY